MSASWHTLCVLLQGTGYPDRPAGHRQTARLPPPNIPGETHRRRIGYEQVPKIVNRARTRTCNRCVGKEHPFTDTPLPESSRRGDSEKTEEEIRAKRVRLFSSRCTGFVLIAAMSGTGLAPAPGESVADGSDRIRSARIMEKLRKTGIGGAGKMLNSSQINHLSLDAFRGFGGRFSGLSLTTIGGFFPSFSPRWKTAKTDVRRVYDKPSRVDPGLFQKRGFFCPLLTSVTFECIASLQAETKADIETCSTSFAY